MNKKEGYILIFTVSVMTIMIVMVTLSYTAAQSYFSYVKLIENRERAKALAISGVELALSQLYLKKPKQQKSDDKKDAKKQGPNEAQLFFAQVFPILNRWQTVHLDMPEDGLDGTIEYYIACEDGKLNINQLYDAEKKSLRGNPEQQKKLREGLFGLITSAVHSEVNLLNGIEELEKKNRIIDVTQLINEPGYSVFKDNMFVREPSAIKKLPLTDIFTTWSHAAGLNPWFMSQSLADILKLGGAATASKEEKKESIEAWAKDLKVSVNSWAKEWDQTLAKIYGMEFKGLPPDLGLVMATKFGPKTFSVVSYGNSNNIIQKVFAIVERSGNSYGDIPLSIKKLYWI